MPQFFLYCAGEGKFILKLAGETTTSEFTDIVAAVMAARMRHSKAALVVYDAAGGVVMDTFI
ncbi:MAG: hypothetical protein ABJF10_03085 [Chthoniobacter sp.]|uniref:hypothetical protein n=1 Tax=Chthoniobacter sp. TaxID=2510640 RepID=UPI0032AAB02C